MAPLGAACVMVKVRLPPTVMAPERAGPVLAATWKPTAPGPLPVPPDVIEIQEMPLVAVQGHPSEAATVTLPVVPAAGTLRLEGVNPVVQVAVAVRLTGTSTEPREEEKWSMPL